MGGDGVANGDRVCVCVSCADAAPAKRGPVRQGTRAATTAVRLRSPAVHQLGISVSTRKIGRFILDAYLSSALPGMRKWMRTHTHRLDLLQGLERPAGEECIRPILPSWCSVHVAIVDSLMCG